MITEQIFQKVLLDPAMRGGDTLCAVAGYATAAMAFHHQELLRKEGIRASVRLIVGMGPAGGILFQNHLAFKQLVREDWLECNYVRHLPQVHTKSYVWLKNGMPLSAFLGSANYTQQAFLGGQREALAGFDPDRGFAYFRSLLDETVSCTDGAAQELVSMDNSAMRPQGDFCEAPQFVADNTAASYGSSVDLSFLDRSGQVPEKSGLNWGQRSGREPNQAYIHIPADIGNSGFFPERGVHFSLCADDGEVLICTRAQDNGKAIETPHDNSILGKYFRRRAGLSDGSKVLKEDLERYGRTGVTIRRVDGETFSLDFSPIVAVGVKSLQ